MFIVTVMYPYSEGARFDWDYYVGTHMPLVREAFGPTGLADARALKGLPGPNGAPPPYVAIALITYPDHESVVASMTGPRAGDVAGDLPNFTDITPFRQISEVQ